MSDCCWKCRAGAGPCCGSRGVGFTPVAQTPVLSRSKFLPPRAPSFDSLVRPVANGPLAQRLQPAKASLGGLGAGVSGLRGVGAERVQQFGGSTASTIYHSVPLSWPINAAYKIEEAVGLKGAAGSIVRTLFDPVGAILFGGGIFGKGLFRDDSAEKRKQKNTAMYSNSWNAAKGEVVDQITNVQHRLDTIDRDLIALDKTLSGLDDAVKRAGSAPAGVAKLVADAHAKRRDAESVVQALRDTQDNLNAAADAVREGESANQTGPGSAAQKALAKAADLASGVEAQIGSVARSVTLAVNTARAATSQVNRWVDQEAARAQAAQQQQFQANLVDVVTKRLSVPPQGWVYDANGNLQPLGAPQASPPQLVGPTFPGLQ